MPATAVTAQRFGEGYPRSSEADLDPGSDLTESLEDADREAVKEQRCAPEGRGPDGSADDEESFAGESES